MCPKHLGRKGKPAGKPVVRKPEVTVKPRSYQRTRAEMEEVVKIEATPQELALAILRPACVVVDSDARSNESRRGRVLQYIVAILVVMAKRVAANPLHAGRDHTLGFRMLDFSSPVPAFLGIFFTTFAAISGFGFYIDRKISEEYRSRTRDILNRFDPDTWPTSFLALYDGIFLSSIKGQPKVARSVSASFLTVVFVAVIWGIRQPNELDVLMKAAREEPFTVITVLGFALTCNFMVDYFSYWETRLVINRITKIKRRSLRAALVFLDLFATIAIFLVGLFLGLFSGFAVSGAIQTYVGQVLISDLFDISNWREWTYIYSTIIMDGSVIFAGDEETRVFGVFFLSTLFTSVWVWAYMIGIFLLPVLSFLKKLFNIDVYPVGAAMTIGAVFLAFAAALLTLIPAADPVTLPD